MQEKGIPKGNKYEEFQLAKGYWIGSLDPDFPSPDFVFRGNVEESFDLRDRDFTTVDNAFGRFLSQILIHMTQTRQTPIDVLDIGGGTTSRAAREIAQTNLYTTRVINVDVALSNNSQETQNFRNLCEDACEMSIPNNSIDLAYSWQMIYGLNKDRRHKVLGEIARVLKHGGVALINENNFSVLSPSDPRLTQLSDFLSVNVLLRRGNFTDTIGIDDKYVNMDRFLMLMKPPIDPNIVSMQEVLK